jgi:hypothetical protein
LFFAVWATKLAIVRTLISFKSTAATKCLSGHLLNYPTDNLETLAMPFRMSKTLRFWVEVECDEQDLTRADDREVAAILRGFEQGGNAMRSLNRKGRVIWKATPEFLDRLADAEKEADDEDRTRE